MPEKDSFANLFAQETDTGRRAAPLNVGDQVDGVVAHIGGDTIFVELDEKRQGYLDTNDVPESAGLQVGGPVRAFIIAMDDGEIRLGMRFSAKDAGAGHLEAAFEGGAPIEGKVSGVNKGGLEVEVAGVRAFCPASQIADRFVEDMSVFVGQTHRFLVTELKDRSAVLSRRRLLDVEKAEATRQVLGQIEVGAVLSGRVTQLRDFGAFVDLGGIDGLLPRSELSHERSRPEEVLAEGDVVRVKVLGMEEKEGKTRITLSLKALAADPWDGIEVIAPVGKVVAGRVTRRAEFGLFVRLAEGVEGLLHVSELAGLGELEVGDQILAAVKSVDKGRRRIALVPAPEGAEVGTAGLSSGPVVASVVDATVDKIETFGVFVQVDGTRGRIGRGLIPNAETGLERGVDLRKELPPGSKVRAKVLETGEGRLRLSIKAAKADLERAEYDGYRETHGAPKSMGTFGDLLKNKLKK